jgi:hypothetical protein
VVRSEAAGFPNLQGAASARPIRSEDGPESEVRPNIALVEGHGDSLLIVTRKSLTNPFRSAAQSSQTVVAIKAAFIARRREGSPDGRAAYYMSQLCCCFGMLAGNSIL